MSLFRRRRNNLDVYANVFNSIFHCYHWMDSYVLRDTRVNWLRLIHLKGEFFVVVIWIWQIFFTYHFFPWHHRFIIHESTAAWNELCEQLRNNTIPFGIEDNRDGRNAFGEYLYCTANDLTFHSYLFYPNLCSFLWRLITCQRTALCICFLPPPQYPTLTAALPFYDI
jgi:hypothetical protein